MNFYGREQELKKLEKLFTSREQKVSLIYGRRRVGKSELIKQGLFRANCSSIYYECKQTTEQNNTDSLSVLIAEQFHFPQLRFGGLEEALDFLFQKSKESQMILVLDEYPYLRETARGLDSILQTLIDRYRDTSSLKLILCGSYVEVMKSLLLTENPLYGRVDLTIHLKPMDYYEAALFYPEFSDEDKVRLYSVFGGIPYFNRLIDPKLSVRENIMELIVSPGARLENEVSMYLKSEISKMTNANEVFEALARGYSRYNDLLSQSHVSSSPTLADVLERLIRMEIVQKEAPINEEHNRKKTGYFIKDPLSLFYYRYVFRFLSQRNIMDPDIFYERYISEEFETKYVPHLFEQICKQYLIRQNRRGLLPESFERIGKYYYDDPKTRSNGEFDIVTQDAKGYIFYEAKFRGEPLNQQRIKEEIRQVQACGLNCYKYGFFSRTGFSCEPGENLIFIELRELYKKPGKDGSV